MHKTIFGDLMSKLSVFFKSDHQMAATATVATAAISLSLAAAITCFISLPVLLQKITIIRQDLASGMAEFKLITEDTWGRIISVKVSKMPKKRELENGICNCYEGEIFLLLLKLILSHS